MINVAVAYLRPSWLAYVVMFTASKLITYISTDALYTHVS